LQNL